MQPDSGGYLGVAVVALPCATNSSAKPPQPNSCDGRGDLSEDRAAVFEQRQAEVEALQRAVEALGEALGQPSPALAPITTARERGEGAISLIVLKVSCLLTPASAPLILINLNKYAASRAVQVAAADIWKACIFKVRVWMDDYSIGPH